MPTDDELSHVAELLDQRFGLVTLWLFGSRASGRARPDSDTDIAALFRRDVDALELAETASELARQLGCDVDLVDLSVASPALAMSVLRSGKVIADVDPRARQRFATALPSRYEDLRIVRAPIERHIRERLDG